MKTKATLFLISILIRNINLHPYNYLKYEHYMLQHMTSLERQEH